MPDAQTFGGGLIFVLAAKLKDAGASSTSTRSAETPTLVHIPLSLQYVDEAFDRLPEYADLRSLIAPLVPELRSPNDGCRSAAESVTPRRRPSDCRNRSWLVPAGD